MIIFVKYLVKLLYDVYFMNFFIFLMFIVKFKKKMKIFIKLEYFNVYDY